MPTKIQIRNKGVITLPVRLRKRYGLNEGDVLTLIDMGDGNFLLRSEPSQLERMGNEVARIMQEEGISLDDMLKVLEEEREHYYKEHYA